MAEPAPIPARTQAVATAGSATTALDWLKAGALLLVVLDHVGLYLAADDWLRVPGRLAAPIFFFLIGFSARRSVPLSWIICGLGLTALDVYAEDGIEDASLNILLNLALLRVAMPTIERFVVAPALAGRSGPIVVFAAALAAAAPFTGDMVEYGTQGWLWALAAVALRLARADGQASDRMGRLLLAFAALVTYAVEVPAQGFGADRALLLAPMLAALAALLATFRREAAMPWVPAPVAAVLRLAGRRTLEIYAVQIVLFEGVLHG